MKKKSLLLILLMALIAPWAAKAQTRETQTFNFEDQTIPTTWTNDATYPWVVTDAAANDGTYSIKSSNYHVGNSTSSISATFTFAGDGSISFAVRCSSEQTSTSYDWDYGTFYIDGVQQGDRIVNSTTFSTLNYEVEAGEHTFMWKYKKDGSVNGQDDCLYVDDVVVDLGTAAATPKPTNFAVSNILHNQADLSWTENGTATSWQICVNDDETNLITVTTNPYTLTGLTPLTAYTVKVRSIGSPNSDWSSLKSFTTKAVAVAVGDSWSDDFEGTSCGWELVNGSQTNKWFWGTAVNDGGTHAIYISNSNDGSTHNYNNGSDSYVYATKLLTFTNSKYTFEYNWRANGESTWDYLRVWLAPSTFEFTAGQLPNGSSSGNNSYVSTTPTGWIPLDNTVTTGGKLNLQNTWQSKSLTQNVTEGNWYLVFMWCNDGGSGAQQPAAVDNISITRVACPYDVTDLAVTASSITTTEATITWTAGDATEWQVAKKASGDTDWTILPNTHTAATATLTGLTAGTTYQVKARAYCNATDQGTWCDAISFTTECDVFNLTVKDFSENFNSYTVSTGFLPNCWTRINTGTNTTYNKYPYLVSGSGTSSSNCLRFYSYYSSSSTTTVTDQYAILPEMNGLSGKQIVLSAKGYNASSSFSIGLMSDPEDISTFQEIDTKALTTSYQEFLFDLPTTTANYVAIKMQAPTTSGTTYGVYIDDITIADPPQCAKPTSFAKANVTAHTVDLSWESDASAWVVAYKKTADENFTEVNVTTKTYQLTGLVGETEYVAKVKADCGSNIYSEYTNTVSFTTLVACAKPTALTVSNISTDGATLDWTSEAGEFVVAYKADGDTDFTEITNVTKNAYIFDALTAGTVYTAKVKAVCGGEDGESQWSNTTTFTTSFCATSDMCSVGIELNDSYGDGWNGNKLQVVDVLTNVVLGTYTLSSGASASYTLAVCDGRDINFVYVASGNYQYENGWVITDAADNIINLHVGGDSSDPATAGVIATHTVNCPSCIKPSNLQATAITTNSATMSWTGSSDSYVLQYRPWTQVGEDRIATDEFVTYEYDLSAFTGMGSIAIRHYDVTDVFYLNVDDVVLKASDNSIIFSEDFESGSIPATWTNYDVDGDGYTWDLASSANMNVNGNYGVYSASWLSTVGALTPDNWLIINNVELGGTFSFAARGQDPNYPSENFAVYISLESNIVEIPLTATTYNVTGLVANTPYAWQVKGICGTEQTVFVSSLFKTKDDVLVFATDGNWNELGNWEDVDGNPATALPTTTNNIRIDANAIIPATVVANANKATINGGSITIAEGGQLKHSAATLRVTMNKAITGYGSGADKWSFISSPFTGVTKVVSVAEEWSHVLNLNEGDYDLFGFNSANPGGEWINYKCSSANEVFTVGSNTGLRYTYGYLCANKVDKQLVFTGTTAASNNNTVTLAHIYNPTSTDLFHGFQLVGNPFSCNGYLTFTPDGGQTPTKVDFYTMNTNGDGFDLSETNVALTPLQGAFFYADATGTINFSSEVPSSKALAGALNINLAQNGKTADQARVRFGEGMRLAKASFRDNTSTIYFTEEDKDYAVVYTNESGEMPLNFKAETTGQYTISMKLDGANLGYLHLYDKITGEDINLFTTPEYSFIGTPGDMKDRFIIRFSETTANDIFAYQNGDEIIVSGEGELQIFDVMGRFVTSMEVNGSERISAEQYSNAVYIFRLVGNDVKTQKIVVR